ncbi:2-methylcitrate dehydratase PrpD [Paraburkholderia sp. HC6.4b]|uniref:MmgE/PrpD family protein n=1 Tax=unclassified Paraburkholderia TaxID=2615204 RepID=UPI0016144C26|nr:MULTISPECIES: MmgE/PrpD family protein [unclassified Paraburkholderia]MBB5411121.1 2-methylcitrate dehydratase PrpD [Paraburkholderia sp. HC6.4b]MBB5453893.1 2-methylcitrate dehydratase PrpD [Paraburkholderia sp. Kb1A]
MKSPVAYRDPHTTVVDLFASYVEEARDRPVPQHVSDVAIMHIFDLISAAGAGIYEQIAVVSRDLALETFRRGRVQIWFTGAASSVIGAAWANSAAASALDVDDGDPVARGHLGAAVIPTAFAVAHEVGATFDEIVRAIVIGYQVGATIATARTSYGTTGTWAPYAVVATAGALRDIGRRVLAHALAIAGEAAPNCALMSAPAPHDPLPEGSDVKEGIPWSVVTGLNALEAAQKGMTGPRNILDSVRHYKFPVDLDEVIRSGSRIRDSYFKFYSCCRHIHGPLDALQELMAKNKIKAPDIQEIKVEIYDDAMRLENRCEPQNLPDIQYSIPYCLALVALFGPQVLLPLSGGALNRNDVSALARRVLLSCSADIEAVYPQQTLSRVTITCGSGTFSSGDTVPKGKGEHVTWQELESKFKMATRLVALPAQQNEIVEAVHQARAGNASSLMTCLAEVRFDEVDRRTSNEG